MALAAELHILSLDDQILDARLLKRHLERSLDHPISFTHHLTPEEALVALDSEEFDLLFLDYQLTSEQTGIDFLRFLRAHGHRVATVMLTGHGSEYFAMDAARAGADGYLTKSDLNADSLRRIIAYAREQAQRRSREPGDRLETEKSTPLPDQMAALNVQLAQLGRLDGLTRVLNQAAITECVEMVHQRAKRCSADYCLAMIHIDAPEKHDEKHDSSPGDECLARLAQTLAHSIREDDFIGRFDGDNFLIIYPETSIEQATTICKTLQTEVYAQALPRNDDPNSDRVTVSIGVASGAADDWETAVDRARRALGAARATGHNRVFTFASAAALPNT